MIFYHGTSSENWDKIQDEGILWGYNIYKDKDGHDYKSYRYTYLTPNLDIAKKFGNVVLEVEYEPVGVDGTKTDNYGFNPPKNEYCWQFSVFVPISLSCIKNIFFIN